MIAKLSVLVLVSFLGYQATVQAASYVDAINAIEDARKAIANAANIGIEITELDLERLSALHTNLDNIKLRFDLYFNIINQLQAAATDAGQDPSKCLTDYANVTTIYKEVSAFQAAKCDRSHENSTSVLMQTVMSLKQQGDVAYNLLQTLSACNYESTCINNVVTQANEAGKSIPHKIMLNTTMNELLVYKTTTQLPQCQDNVETGLQGAEGISINIVDCLSKLVYGSGILATPW